MPSDPPDWLAGLVRAALASPPEAMDVRLQPPTDGSGRAAAVLMAVCDVGDAIGEPAPAVLLIERSTTMRAHPGQVAFPGGAVELADIDAADTALREAAEEVGLDVDTVTVLASMAPRFLPPSGFIVTPVIGWWREPHPIEVVDAGEVARAVVVAIADLADPANRFQVQSPRFGHVGPGFEAEGLFIWGFTAMLLSDLLRLGGWERPWNRDNLRPLPIERVP